MRRKFFIVFMLISLFLIACGQNGKKPVDPVDNAAAQLKLKEEEEERKLEQEERFERRTKIVDIKRNGIPSEVIEILKEYRKGPSKLKGIYEYYAYSYYDDIFGSINEVFKKVPYKNGVDDNGNEFVYSDIRDKTTADVAARQAAREEVLLAFGYSSGFARAFGELAKKLVETSALLTKNKDKLKDLLIKIRDCAKAYYLDAYDTLENKLGILELLSAAEVKSLHDNLDLLKTEREKLVSNVVEPLKDKYPIIGECLADPASSSISNTLTADEIETYWDTLSAEFDSICAEIIRISGEIKGILDNIKVKG
ncbi:virulence associated lipoprotein [Borrelia hispanica]|uniref:virulence associated lipoprotein n=1 Tax=Borrelia hispanica TaxID=40835 RepID=UPI0004B39B42|nr:virulence associated lipoprotein [Borrelia hispanica]